MEAEREAVVAQEITTNDPFNESDPFVDVREPLAHLKTTYADVKAQQAAEAALAKHAKSREALKTKYVADRKKFEVTRWCGATVDAV